MDKSKETLTSINEASQRLRVSPFTIRRLIRTKALDATRIGRRIFIRNSEIDRAMTRGAGKYAKKL